MKKAQDRIKEMNDRITDLEGQVLHLSLELDSIMFEEGTWETEKDIKALKKKYETEASELMAQRDKLISQQQSSTISNASGQLNSAHMYAGTQANSQTKKEKPSLTDSASAAPNSTH